MRDPVILTLLAVWAVCSLAGAVHVGLRDPVTLTLLAVWAVCSLAGAVHVGLIALPF